MSERGVFVIIFGVGAIVAPFFPWSNPALASLLLGCTAGILYFMPERK